MKDLLSKPHLISGLLFLAGVLLALNTHAEDFLYFDPFLDGRPVKGEIEAFTQDYETVFVAAESLRDIMHIHLNIDNSQVSGWMYFQNKQILGHFAKGQITVADKVYPLAVQDIIKQEDVYYVAAKAIERWFSLKLAVDINRLMINFNTGGKHPLFEAIKRKARHAQIDSFKIEQQQMISQDNDYDWFNWPVSDIRLNQNFGSNRNTQLSVTSSFDAFAHNVSLLTNHNGGTELYRLRAQREGQWQGQPFNYELGDIYFPAGKFLRAGFQGRGFAFHGNRLSQEHARNFQVEGLPGWELELYRENQLIDYSELDERGQYTFEGIDVNAGFNDYKVVLYGPNGEVEQRHYDFNVSRQGVYRGKWLPEFYYIEPQVMTLGSDNNDSAVLQQIAIGHLNYGLTDNVQLGFGGIFGVSESSEDTPFSELRYSDRSNYLDVGIALPKSAEEPAWSVDYAHQHEKGSVRFSQYKTFAYDLAEFQRGQSLSWQQNGQLWNSGIGWSSQSQPQGKRQEISANLGFSVGHDNYSGTLNYQDGNNYAASMIARLMISQHLLQLRANLQKTANFTDKQLQATWRKSFGLHSFNVKANYSTSSHKLAMSMDYSLDVDDYNFGARLMFDEQNKMTFSLSLSTALAWDAPLQSMTKRNYANTSRIKTTTYWDKNNNQRFDQGDEPLADIRFRGANHWRNDKTDERGMTTLYGAYSFRPQYIEVDTSELDNPFLSPKNERYKVVSHPGGEVAIEIPFYEQFEVEGDVKQLSGDVLEGLANVPIELLAEGQVVRQITTEYDGYFLFEGVMPGKYQVRIALSYLQQKALQMSESGSVEIQLESGSDGLLILDPFVLARIQ